MTDEELIAHLRDSKGWPNLGNAAADRIEQLVKERDAWVGHAKAAIWTDSEELKLVEAKLTKAVDALQLVTDACDEGKLVSLGAGGMTIDAQIRRSVYNQVPAWLIEEARATLAELKGEQQ